MAIKRKSGKTFEGLIDYIMVQIKVYKENNHPIEFYTDALRNNIFYQTSSKQFHTGLYSEGAFNERKSGTPNNKLCQEHWYGLKRLTDEILNGSYSKDALVKLIKEKASWNYTTSEENVQLKNAKQSYEKAGIKLNTYDGWINTADGEYPKPTELINANTLIKSKHKYW